MARKIITELTEEELHYVNRLSVLISDETIKLTSLNVMKKVWWKNIAKKYKLPDDFNFDMRTGEITPMLQNVSKDQSKSKKSPLKTKTQLKSIS